MLKKWAHKAEIVEDAAGGVWYNKACRSNRIATTCVDTTMKSNKCKRFYMYLGGGAVDQEQTELLSGAVVHAKNWSWAALAVVAARLVTMHRAVPVWVRPQFVRSAGSTDNTDILHEIAEPDEQPVRAVEAYQEFEGKCAMLWASLQAVLPQHGHDEWDRLTWQSPDKFEEYVAKIAKGDQTQIMRDNIAKVTRDAFAIMRFKADSKHREDMQKREHSTELQGKSAGKTGKKRKDS